jgi:acylglycerol lipase
VESGRDEPSSRNRTAISVRDDRGRWHHLRGEASYPAGTAKAVVVLAHGKDEHIGRYQHVVAALNDGGFASDGPRGVIARFDDFVDDLDLLVEHVRAEQPSLPMYLLGYSMGGLIATRYALARQTKLSGLVLSGPALLIDEEEPGWTKRLLLLLGRIAPNLHISTSQPGLLSRNPEVERDFSADPLCNNERTRLGFARELYLASEAFRPRAAELSPLLIMHGDADRLTSPRGSVKFFDNASSPDKNAQALAWQPPRNLQRPRFSRGHPLHASLVERSLRHSGSRFAGQRASIRYNWYIR